MAKLSLFNKLTKKKEEIKEEREKKLNDGSNPYLNARTEWLERYGEFIQQRRNWQIATLAALATSFICVFFLGFLATQNKLVPYVIEVDKLGNTAKVGVIQNMNLKNPNVIKYSLNTFVYDWRSVWGSIATQKRFILDSYNYILKGSKAFNLVNEGFIKHNPFTRLTEESVSVGIKSILPTSADTWVVEWVETVKNLEGKTLSKTPYRGYFRIRQIIPTSEEQILKNPLGIFITDINYSKVI